MTTHKVLSAIEQVELQDEVESLRQREAELAAYVERLRNCLGEIIDMDYEMDGLHAACALALQYYKTTPPQALHDRDMRIAEAVRDRIDHVLKDRGESWSLLLSSINLRDVLESLRNDV